MRNISLDWIAVSLIFSVFSIIWLPDFLLLEWQTAMVTGGSCLIVALLFRLFGKIRILLVFIKLALLIVFLGYAHFQPLNLLKLADNMANLPSKISTEFVVEEIQHQQDYQTLILRARLQPDLPEQLIYANWKGAEQVKLGERWHGELQLRPLSSRLNQGGFDRQQWYFSKGITAWANVKSAVKISDVFTWRQQRLNAALQQTQGLAHQGLLLATSFGERAWLKADSWQIYQQTNTAHLIAISGLHIGLAMVFGFILARGLQIMLPTRWITPLFPILTGLGCAYFYAQLAGFAIPTFRAIIALIILYLLRIGRVYCSPWQLFLRVIALLLISDPLMVLSASFWLSVGAVGSLILWYQVFPLQLLLWRGQSLSQGVSAKVRWLLGLLHLQLGLLWLFTPIQLAVFGGFSLQGFCANLIAVPLFSFILVPLVLCAVLTNGSLFLWQIADFVAEKLEYILSFWQGGWVNLSEKTTLILTALLIGLFLIAMRLIYRPSIISLTNSNDWLKPTRKISLKTDRNLAMGVQRNIILLGVITIGFCFVRLIYQQINKPDWQIETLDVGQGLATLLIKNGHGVLYDTGAGWAGGNMAKIEIIPYLQRQGVKLDWLIISHDDNDHSGGAKEILTAYLPLKFISPSRKNYGFKNDETIDRTFCRQGERWQWQGLSFRVLSPPDVVDDAENPDSCVLFITDGQHSLLLTGDADIRTERRFASGLGKIEVLQVGHHGSKTSTGSRLVSQIQPKIALISSGRWNPWRFPHPDVMNRLENAQSAVYNSAVFGQISVRFYGDNTEIRTARTQFLPWYQRLIGRLN